MTDYKNLLEKYMSFLVDREGTCFVSFDGPNDWQGEADFMNSEERKALGMVYKSLALRRGWDD